MSPLNSRQNGSWVRLGRVASIPRANAGISAMREQPGREPDVHRKVKSQCRTPSFYRSPRRCGARAVEVLVRAETMVDADARQVMCEIAARYEELAKRLEYESG